MKSTSLRRALLCAIVFVGVQTAVGQNSSLYQQELPPGDRSAAQLQHGSWTFIPRPPPPKQLAKNDIVFVRVDEVTRTLAEGDMERRKDAQYDTVLLDWIRLRGLRAIQTSPQAGGDQRIPRPVAAALPRRIRDGDPRVALLQHCL